MELYIILIRHKMKRVGVGQLIIIWDLDNTATIHYSKIPPQCHAVAFKFFSLPFTDYFTYHRM